MQTRFVTLVFLGLALGATITARAQEASGPFRNAPRELRELSTFRLGELVPDVAVETVAGEKKRLSEAIGENGLVVAFRSVMCPVSQAPRSHSRSPRTRICGARHSVSLRERELPGFGRFRS